MNMILTKAMKRVYLDLRASSGYTEEAEKLERNYLKINFAILLKKAATKAKAKNMGIFLGGIFVSVVATRPHITS